MHDLILHINSKFEKLIDSDYCSFEKVASLKNVMGVYMIYDENKQLLYIGNTNKFHIRFGTDLKHETTHTLVRKLISKGLYNDRYEVVNFLKNQCYVRIAKCDSKREAEALEHLAIYILDPPYNNHYFGLTAKENK